jgi:Cu2+-exporting ATPase
MAMSAAQGNRERPDAARSEPQGGRPRSEPQASEVEQRASEAHPSETGLFLDGLRCAGCAHRIERSLRGAPGVLEAQVNYSTHRARVRFDPQRTDARALARVVEDLGYSSSPYDPAALDRSGDGAARAALARLLVAAFLAANVMLVAVALYLGEASDLDAATRRGLRWLAVALAAPAVLWCALPFWRGAWAGLRRREITMDVPVVLGIAVSFGTSVAGTLAEAPHLYMDSAAMIVFLILLGRTLERRAGARAAAASMRLAALTPATALRRTERGTQQVPVERLAVGDRVVVPAGQCVPVDGRIVRGETEIDESLLTGEALPAARLQGARVAGGTRNLLAEIELEVSARVSDGTAARLAALLERAQAERPHVQRLADRVAAVFAPAVVLVAAATALGWWWAGAGALQTALTAAAVLIVACPCALGLATPAAVTAAVGRAATLGILVKSGEALERLARVDTAVLDKTGTLSEGCFRVVAVEAAADGEAAEVLGVAARAEGASTHPVAEAVRRAAGQPGGGSPGGAPPRTRPGLGVESWEGDVRVRVGSRRWLEEAGVRVAPRLQDAGRKLAGEGRSLAWVARGEDAIGVIGLSDPLRGDAARAVAQLSDLGIRAELVSGDHADAVARAAGEAGVAAFLAAATPEDKVARIRARRAEGGQVLAVGDGINDAAALSAADVGVAMARGADVTLHAADLVIRSPRLASVAHAVSLSRSTLRRIRENLGFALLYNVVAIPLAVSGWLPPLQAAVAMSLSSLLVTGNSVRLLRWRPRP